MLVVLSVMLMSGVIQHSHCFSKQYAALQLLNCSYTQHVFLKKSVHLIQENI